MAQWPTALAEDLSSVPRRHMVEGRNQLPQVVLTVSIGTGTPPTHTWRDT